MANEDTRPETQEPEVRDVPSVATPEAAKVEQDRPSEPPHLTTPAEPHVSEPAVKAPAAAHKRSVFLPLLLGGALAALLGFGLARVVPNGWPVQDIAPLQSELQRQAQEITALRDQIGALTIPSLTPLEGRVSALENPPVAPAALQAQIEELRNQINSGTVGADLQGMIDRTQQELADAQKQAEALRLQSQDTAQKALVTAALTRIAGALDSGTPYGAAVQEIQEAGLEVPQPLADGASGVPALTTLQQEFPEASRAALEESLKVDGGNGVGNRLGAFLRAQTGARSLEPREGNDPDAILSRAEAAVQGGNLPLALDEIGHLPLEGQAALSDWRAKAERRMGAVDALAQMNTGTR
ncbi:COG4223 family protein [Falsirhodobacter sp. 1013]|uniref:COG4223 family protein n=1 Tax=Falsirhodobacter sp. 1013 TaxID=3417566 RepID=UPI003EBDFAE3